MNRFLVHLRIVFVSIGGSFAQNHTEKLKMPGPDVQNFMLGSWSTQLRYEPTPEMPNGGRGSGSEIWRPGPRGVSSRGSCQKCCLPCFLAPRGSRGFVCDSRKQLIPLARNF